MSESHRLRIQVLVLQYLLVIRFDYQLLVDETDLLVNRLYLLCMSQIQHYKNLCTHNFNIIDVQWLLL